VQQWFVFSCLVKVARLLPQHKIRNESCSGRYVLPELLKLVREQTKPTQCPYDRQHDDQRRENPLCTARIEVNERELAVLQVTANDRRDQKPGNDEEDIDTDISAGKERGTRVKSENGQNAKARRPSMSGGYMRSAVACGEKNLAENP
jgi:hypothetical protein